MALNIRQHKGKASLADTGFNLVVFGNPGSGKSTMAASFPDVLYVDTQQGTRFIDSKMDVVSINSWQDVKDIIALMQAEDSSYKTVVWDVIDQVLLLYMEFLRQQKPGLFTSLGTPQISAWNIIKPAWLKFMKLSCQNDKFNSVFIAHEKSTTDDQGKLVSIRPSMSPSLLSIMIGEVDFVGFKTDVYSLDFRENPVLPDVKDRENVLKNLDSPLQNATYALLRDVSLGKVSPLAATLPARFSSIEQAYSWALKLGITKEETDKIMASIESPKKAVEFRKILFQKALKSSDTSSAEDKEAPEEAVF